ncbi:MAG: hypothetical protein OEY67_10960, partial [Gammaproteobacteria bacterium]|nr:hypothetical protein [Gammaproteobacteria bacterium]
MRKSIGVVLVLFQVSAHAGNLHVAQGGVGLACTDVDPCGSVQLAVDQAVEGDVVAIAPGVYRENILVQTAGITLLGESANNTIIQTKGGREGAVGNAGNPLDAIVEVQAANISLINLTLMHPRGNAVKREAAVFAWKGAPGLHIKNCIIERQRNR